MTDFLDRVKGFGITFREMLQRPVTIQYPEERRPLPPRFRGLPVLVVDPDTGREKCVACGLCAQICPNNVLAMTSEPDREKGRRPATFTLNAPRCLFCGLCEQACPERAIVMSHRFELSTDFRRELIYNKEELMELGRYIWDDTKVEADTENVGTRI